MVPEFCTCGAELPPEARFCHKCGKPQWEEPLPEPVAAPPVQPPPAQPPPVAEVSFRNRVAVRTGLLVAAIALALSSIPLAPWLPFVWMLGAGVFSVYLYNRRTGQPLSVRSGMRMGWITGVFTFLFSMVLITIGLALIAGQADAFARVLREQSNLPKEMTDRALEILRSPAELLVSLLMGFVSFTAAGALGGALGARVFSKN